MIASLASGLDSGRVRLLGWTTRSRFLRDVIRCRWKRHLLLFLPVICLQLALSVFFPFPVLVLGPVFLGGPHLIASFRHGLGASPKRIFLPFRLRVVASGGIWLAVTWIRLAGARPGSWVAEILGWLTLALIWAPALEFSFFRGAALLAVVAGLTFGTWKAPLATLAFLVLFHHFIAFFHWARAAVSFPEKAVVGGGLVLFSVVHLLIFCGVFDPWIGGAQWRGMPPELLEGTFLAWTHDPMAIMRCLVAYAFGQSVHYALWLKFIPEQQHLAEMAPSFRQSLRLFVEDFGETGSRFAFLGLIALFTFAGVLSSPGFRQLYFGVASFHGFYELFGLLTDFRNT